MRKILIATPLKGGVDQHYIQTFYKVLSAKIPGIQFGFCFVSGTGVNFARNEIAAHMMNHGFTELVFWDKDINASYEQWLRLLSHDGPEVVCALYAAHTKRTIWHFNPMEGEEVDPKTGLIRVKKCAIGFSKISRAAFEKIMSAHPERWAHQQDNGQTAKRIYEFFPNGIVGPNSWQGKIARIREVLNGKPEVGDKLGAIKAIAEDDDYSGNRLLGEDYYFCELCEEAGVPVHLDSTLLVAHTGGSIETPIPTKELEEMLEEPWRQEERSK